MTRDTKGIVSSTSRDPVAMPTKPKPLHGPAMRHYFMLIEYQDMHGRFQKFSRIFSSMEPIITDVQMRSAAKQLAAPLGAGLGTRVVVLELRELAP